MRVELDLFKNEIIAVKYYSDGRKEYVHGDVDVNDMLNGLYASEGKSLFELIADNTIVITKRVWGKYELLDNKAIIRRTFDDKKTKTTSGKTTTTESSTTTTMPKAEPSTVAPEPSSMTSGSGFIAPSGPTTSDGAIDVGGATVTEERETKPKKGIKNLKRVGLAALALVVGGYILVGGYNNLFKKDKNNENNNDGKNDDRYEQNIDADDEVYEVIPDNPDEVNRYVDQGSVVQYDDMQTQIDSINEVCFTFEPCTLENLVVDSDREAIATINSMRNRVLNGTCDADTYLNNVVNYIFENGTIFDNKVIKGYDSLSTYAQYVVLVASQSVLQLDINYDHTTAYNNYNFNVLVNSFDYMVNDTYTSLMNVSKTR